MGFWWRLKELEFHVIIIRKWSRKKGDKRPIFNPRI